MLNYKTPGVYVEEISKFPASVVGVATAIPVFVGYTEVPYKKNQAVKVASLVDYKAKYGEGAPLTIVSGKLNGTQFTMYDSMRLFYDNGGSVCYVVSIGKYDEVSDASSEKYMDALESIKKVDEITLLVYPDAATILNETELKVLYPAILKHCGEMQDRFAILDPKKKNSLEATMESFRDCVGSSYLNYGAAYYPYIKTAYSKSIPLKVILENNSDLKDKFYDKYGDKLKSFSIDIDNVKDRIKKISASYQKKAGIVENFSFDNVDGVECLSYAGSLDNITEKDAVVIEVYNDIMKEKDSCSSYTDAITNVTLFYSNISNITDVDLNNYTYNSNNEFIYKEPESGGLTEEKRNAIKKLSKEAISILLSECKQYNDLVETFEKTFIAGNADYEEYVSNLLQNATVIPASGAIAGIYATVDRTKGVWQAPANISVASVDDVVEKLTDQEQENMNVDASTGKSINALRYFQGKGIMVWGARTLDGNSNEWRYVPVRRLFNYVEESVKKATQWAVFQPNDANTWTKVKCQIENFLSNLWRDGALAGSTPEKAFFVNVGLDVTMTADDINNGYMIVEIGMAAVRPAEFIVLQFSHKLQEA